MSQNQQQMIQRKTIFHRIKTKCNVRVATTISIIAFIALAARFMYIFYNGDSDLKGDFSGFKWLSIFLYSVGVELSMVGMGALMWISTQFHSRNSMSKKLFRGDRCFMDVRGLFLYGLDIYVSNCFHQILWSVIRRYHCYRCHNNFCNTHYVHFKGTR